MLAKQAITNLDVNRFTWCNCFNDKHYVTHTHTQIYIRYLIESKIED